MSITVVIVDDDLEHSSFLADWLYVTIPACKLELISTVSDFASRLDGWCKSPPALFVMDIMIKLGPQEARGVFPGHPNLIVNPWDAGITCIEVMQEAAELQSIPVIVHSVREDPREELRNYRKWNHIHYVSKAAPRERILETARAILIAAGLLAVPEPGKLSKLKGSFGTKGRLFGVPYDLESAFKAVKAWKRK